METIGNRIERARKERKISQTSLADAMGISQQQVSYMEGRADSDMTVGFVMAAGTEHGRKARQPRHF